MQRHVLLTVLAAAVVGLGLACGPSEVAKAPESFDEAKALGAATERPILVDFFTTW